MSILRAAVVQIDYNAAAFVDFHYLKEPDDFSHLSYAPKLYRLTTSTKRSENIKAKIQKMVYQDYIQWFRERLIKILDICIAKQAQLVIFPEFSIPLSCLDAVRKKSLGNMIIVAGSHVFLPSQKQQYLDLGIKPPTMPRCNPNICPICFPDGTWEIVLKSYLTRWETRPVFGLYPEISEENLVQSIPLKIKGAGNKKFAILICLDFLEEVGVNGISKNLKDVVFYVVPACSLETETFDAIASFSGRHLHRPTLFVNTALIGGSTIFSNFENIDDNPFFSKDRTYQIPAGDECILISNINLETRAIERPTLLLWNDKSPVTPTSLHSIIPLVYDHYSRENQEVSYSEFLKKIEETNQEGMRNLVQVYIFQHEIAKQLRSEVLHDKLKELNHSDRFHDYPSDYLKWLLEALVFPPSFPSPQEWRFREFCRCIQQIKELFRYGSSRTDYPCWSKLWTHYEKRQEELMKAKEIRKVYWNYSEKDRLFYEKIFRAIIDAGHDPEDVKNQIEEIKRLGGFRKDVAAWMIADKLGVNIEGVLPIEKSRR